MEKLEIFDPTIPPKIEKIEFVPRPESLNNVHIGLVDNSKFNSDKLLIKIAIILENDYGAKNTEFMAHDYPYLRHEKLLYPCQFHGFFSV